MKSTRQEKASSGAAGFSSQGGSFPETILSETSSSEYQMSPEVISTLLSLQKLQFEIQKLVSLANSCKYDSRVKYWKDKYVSERNLAILKEGKLKDLQNENQFMEERIQKLSQRNQHLRSLKTMHSNKEQHQEEEQPDLQADKLELHATTAANSQPQNEKEEAKKKEDSNASPANKNAAPSPTFSHSVLSSHSKIDSPLRNSPASPTAGASSPDEKKSASPEKLCITANTVVPSEIFASDEEDSDQVEQSSLAQKPQDSLSENTEELLRSDNDDYGSEHEGKRKGKFEGTTAKKDSPQKIPAENTQEQKETAAEISVYESDHSSAEELAEKEKTATTTPTKKRKRESENAELDNVKVKKRKSEPNISPVRRNVLQDCTNTPLPAPKRKYHSLGVFPEKGGDNSPLLMPMDTSQAAHEE